MMFFGIFLIILSLFNIAMWNNSFISVISLINICTGSFFIYTSYKKKYKKIFEERRKKKEEEQTEKERSRIKVINDEKHIAEIKRLNYSEESKRRFSEARKRVTVSCNLIMLLKECQFKNSDTLLDRVIQYAENIDPEGITTKVAIQKGSIVFLGAYNSNGEQKKPIEWIVMDISNNQGLLVSRYILDDKPFQCTGSTLLWENSAIRSWLNNGFLSDAFTDIERNVILNKQILNGQQQGYAKWSNTNSVANSTYDKVFLLSYYEVFEKYFKTAKMRQCSPTEHTKSPSSWWLRSPGHNSNYTSFINANGDIEDVYVYLSSYSSNYSNGVFKGVRPAIWVNLDSSIFHVDFSDKNSKDLNDLSVSKKAPTEENNSRKKQRLQGLKRIAIIVSALSILFIVVFKAIIIPNGKYREAISLKHNGAYEEAISAFELIIDYNDSKDQILQCQIAINEREYQRAINLRETGQYNSAIEKFESLADYKDSKSQILETKYQQASSLYAKTKYDESYTIFKSISGYKDVDDLLSSDSILIEVAYNQKIKAMKTVGNRVLFGKYEQDNNLENQKESIEWYIIDVKGDQVLLLSRYGLDCKPYSDNNSQRTWKSCSLRSWLNQDFLQEAFSNKEQEAIITTTIDNSLDQGYDYRHLWKYGKLEKLYGGPNTEDKVFLLSYAEANKYLGLKHIDYSTVNQNVCVSPTEYAVINGAHTYIPKSTGSLNAIWWLRSPGYYDDCSATVDTTGDISHSSITRDEICVRPAIWIDVSNEIFK